jgi:hypothetical protein
VTSRADIIVLALIIIVVVALARHLEGMPVATLFSSLKHKKPR